MRLALDTGVLGMICHPRKFAEVRLWFRGALGTKQHKFFVPEIADFELRRELIRMSSKASLRTLNRMPSEVAYAPITTEVMRDAAALWAGLWNAGLPVEDEKSLGSDAILAAQARALRASVLTENVKHLERMVDVVCWEDLQA